MARVANQHALQPGTVLARRYSVLKTIGKGSMGMVLECTDLHLNQRVAVKVMLPERAHVDEARKRFVREAKTASQLSNEHICRLLEVGELEDGVPFLVMEFLVGATLEQILFNVGPPSVDVVVDWAMQALEGLAEAHAAGFVHRDLKPENIFLHEPSNAPPIVKVLDFGAVKDMSAKATRLTRTGSTMGSPAYMPPEQVRAEEIDQRADVWAMAVTIYELLTAKLPFGGESVPQTLAAILRENPIPLRHHRKDAPVELEALITCALTKDRSARYKNAGEMLGALRTVRAKMPQTSPNTRTLVYVPPNAPQPVRPDAFADTTDMRGIPEAAISSQPSQPSPSQPIIPEDPSSVRRVVINDRGAVINVNHVNAIAVIRPKEKAPILAFVIAICGGLFVAAIVVAVMYVRQQHRREHSGDHAVPPAKSGH